MTDLEKRLRDPAVPAYGLREEAADEIAHLRRLVDPRRWTHEISDTWHRAIPDGLFACFTALREMPRPKPDPR